MRQVVKAAADVRVQDPYTRAMPAQRVMERFDRIHRAAPWAKAIGVGFKTCLPLWLQGRRDNCLHHPVLPGRYSQGSLRPVLFRYIDPLHRPGPIPSQTQALAKQLPAGLRRVVHHAINPCRVFPLVFLGDTSDRQEFRGRGAHKEFLEVLDPPPGLVRRGAVDTLLEASYMRFHSVPTDVSPRGWRMAFGPFSERSHRLTSPRVRTQREFATVRPRRKSAPFRGGYVRRDGPIRSITERRSLFPSSSTLCSVPLPYGRDTTAVGSIGLTQLSMKKNVGRAGWSLYPGGRCGCRHPQGDEVVLPTYHFGDGLSASLAIYGSRGFTRTLHMCST